VLLNGLTINIKKGNVCTWESLQSVKSLKLAELFSTATVSNCLFGKENRLIDELKEASSPGSHVKPAIKWIAAAFSITLTTHQSCHGFGPISTDYVFCFTHCFPTWKTLQFEHGYDVLLQAHTIEMMWSLSYQSSDELATSRGWLLSHVSGQFIGSLLDLTIPLSNRLDWPLFLFIHAARSIRLRLIIEPLGI